MLDYPRVLEDWWLQFTMEKLNCRSLGERQRRLEENIQKLSDQYTKNRDDLKQDYFHDPGLLCAYGLFFFPQTYIRASFVIHEILLRGWKSPERCSILDLGAGTGAASFALASAIKNSRITAVDRSAPALNILGEIASRLFLSCDTVEQDLWAWSKRDQQKYDVIVASFSLSETNVTLNQWTDVFSKLLSDSGVALILEPSLKQTSESLEAWRNEIANNNGLHLWGPCLHRQACPLLREGKFWCHEVRYWEAPESLSFLNRHLYREVHVTKFSFLAFGKTPPVAIPEFAFRVISPISRQKGSFLFRGCGNDGFAHEFRVSGRSLEQEKRSLIQKWERGDILKYEAEGVQILESGRPFVVQQKISPHHEVRNE